MEGEKASDRFRKKRSNILFLITALIIVVFIAFGLATMLLFRSSQNRLIDKSIDKMIESEIENISSASEYIAGLLLPIFEEKIAGASTEELISALLNKRLTEGQRFIVEELKKMVESGVFELQSVFIVMPPSLLNPEALVIAASDEDLIYNWEVPDYVMAAIEEGKTYIYHQEGFAELGMSEPSAIIINKAISQDSGAEVGYVFVKPMGDKVGAIEGFYDEERNRTDLLLWVTLVVSIVVVTIISFFMLSYLIRKRITEPIDELAATAEEVMQGNLDVEITVHEGGEFEGLERAFREMVESFRTYIARSTRDE
ncbi:MAG: HAMP domain-containing protein [Actinobacteria bacterium]|nr:HAMP domain-containing protein [Actinomycetota bacterium]